MSFTLSLSFAAGVLTAKSMVIHLLVARERVNASVNNFAEEPLNFMAKLMKPLFAIGPSMGKVGIDKLERAAQNSAQNESFFILTCLAAAQAKTLPEQAITAVTVFVWSRAIHSFVQVFGGSVGINMGLRTMAYLTSVAANMYIASYAIMGAM